MIRDHAVSMAKGIGIIGVVAQHLANRRFADTDRAWIALLGELCTWAVPLFFIVSGYLHGLSHARRPIGIAVFLRTRARRLLLPYATLSLAYALLYNLLVHASLISDAVAAVTWYKRWFQSLTLTGGVGEQLYFLPLLFLVSTCSVVLLAACRYSSKTLLPLTLALLATALLTPDLYASVPGQIIWPWPCLVSGVAVYLLGFLLGTQPQLRPWTFGGGAVLMLLALASGDAPALKSLYPLVLFSGLLLVSLQSTTLEFLGDGSGTIFLYHTPFFLQSVLLAIAALTPARWHIALAYTALPLTVLYFAYLHRLLLKTRLKWLAY